MKDQAVNEKYSSDTPKVAVIIPVYNDEEYLEACLDSLLNQTVSWWEAWIVDDCSTDNSLNIIERYCENDPRFHMLRNETNSSAWVSRAKGILAVSDSVKYILFADADDTIQPNAVERAYELMEQEPVDILHFGTNVKNCSQKYNDYLQPPIKKLYGRDIFDSFVERSFEGHIWNKMFKAELLRDTINHVGVNHFLPKAQDKALYWAVCWQKDNLTYRGVKDKLYNYNYGSGVEGNNETITLEQYRQYLAQSYTENLISGIMSEHEDEIKKYESVMENSRYNLVRHSARNWFRVSRTEKVSALEEAAKFWDGPLDHARLTCAIAEYSWGNSVALADIAGQAGIYKTEKKPSDIKTIGTYYHRMDNGGIQRVIAELTKYWHRSGYNIVVFTDNDPQLEDYDLPEYVKRVRVAHPASRCKNSDYVKRGMSIAQLIQEYNVDCMVYHAYFSDVLLYDTLICKCLNVPFILYQHNVFSRYIRYVDSKFATISLFSRLADAVVCLDKTSAEWWKCFNGNVHVVINPPSFDLNSINMSPRNNHNILFLGRLVEDAKHPKDAVEIVSRVVKTIPDAKMYIVGTGERKYLDELKDLIKKLHMEEHIIMCGFNKDVEEFYMMSSIFLCCSSHEGFPMTLIESQSFGLPVVMYELPYLTITENNSGIITVPQRDIEAAADEICKLLEDQDKLVATGNAAHDYIVDMFKEDIGLQWEYIFDSINNFYPDICNETQRQLANTMVRDYLDGMTIFENTSKRLDFVEDRLDWNRKELAKAQRALAKNEQNITVRFSDISVMQDTIKSEFNGCTKEIAKMNSVLTAAIRNNDKYLNELNSIRSSFSFKVGRFITWLPRKIRGLFSGKKQ